MSTKRFSKMRIMRMYVKYRNVFYYLLCIPGIIVFATGLYYAGYWGTYGLKYCYHAYILDDANRIYNYSKDINTDYRFCENGTHGWIEKKETHKKIIKDVCWIVGIDDEDSLLCFASKGYRGYLNRNTCKITVPADRYIKAWLFSEGVAAVVEKDSTLKFINSSGEVVIDKSFKYHTRPTGRGFLFENGYCQMRNYDGRWGLIDRQGRWAIVPQYDKILFTEKNCWLIYKDGKQGLLNDSLKLIVPPDYREVIITNHGIEILKEDYIRQLLDYDGKIINHFIYTDIRELYYKTGAVNPEADEYTYALSPYKVYQTTYSSTIPVKVGLMSPNGIPITPPLYSFIEAINADYFRCFYDESGHYYEGEASSIIINRKGQVIEK